MGLQHKVDSIKALHEREASKAQLAERLDGNDLALAELGEMAAENEAATTDIMEALAELGQLVEGA